MTLPDQIGPILPAGNSMNGIISKIREIIPDPVSSGIVSATASSGSAPNSMILSSETTSWQISNPSDIYIQFDFHDRYLFPTHYSFRGYNSKWYARVWTLYGFNAGQESDNSLWNLLSLDTSEGTNYCEPLDEIKACGNNNIGTFSVHPTTQGFRSFRWVLKQCSNPTVNYMGMRGIKLFGILSTHSQYSMLQFPNIKCSAPFLVYRIICTPLISSLLSP